MQDNYSEFSPYRWFHILELFWRTLNEGCEDAMSDSCLFHSVRNAHIFPSAKKRVSSPTSVCLPVSRTAQKTHQAVFFQTRWRRQLLSASAEVWALQGALIIQISNSTPQTRRNQDSSCWHFFSLLYFQFVCSAPANEVLFLSSLLSDKLIALAAMLLGDDVSER